MTTLPTITMIAVLIKSHVFVVHQQPQPEGEQASQQTNGPICQLLHILSSSFRPISGTTQPLVLQGIQQLWCPGIFTNFHSIDHLSSFNVICPSKHWGVQGITEHRRIVWFQIALTKFPARLSVIAVACKPSSSSSCRTTLNASFQHNWVTEKTKLQPLWNVKTLAAVEKMNLQSLLKRMKVRSLDTCDNRSIQIWMQISRVL